MQNNSKEKLVDDKVGLPVSSQDVSIIAQRVTNDPSTKVLDYDFSIYSEEKLGFLGDHRYLNIMVQRKDASSLEKLKVFVKAIPYSCQEQTEFVTSQGIFEKEAFFFGMIIPQLMAGYKGEKWSPQCYLITKDALLMEDLKSQGYKLRKLLFDETVLLKSALSALARFHSCSILAEARLSQQAKHPIKLNELYPDSLNDNAFTKKKSQAYNSYLTGVDISAAVAERLGLNSEKLRAASNRFRDLLKPSPKHHNAICHCDLWTNNIMFDDSLPLPNCVLVDYQICKYAPMVLDVLQFLYLKTTQMYRSRYESELVEFYHSVLEKTVRTYDSTNSAKVPTLKEVSSEFEDLRIFGPMIASYYFPFFLLQEQIKVQNMDQISEYIFAGDRKTYTLKFMEENEFFKRKFEEVITILAELSEQY